MVELSGTSADSRLVQKQSLAHSGFLKKAKFRLESVRHQAAATLTNEKNAYWTYWATEIALCRGTFQHP
ncbi:MAG: hypothetical protein D3916_01715 [Candidatus Electrothrix sp. MAN1_4]|nr:hypothetical protein [Candidatus Electrothrix sp. MAN1_4]